MNIENFIFENDLNEIITLFACDTNIEFLKQFELVYSL